MKSLVLEYINQNKINPLPTQDPPPKQNTCCIHVVWLFVCLLVVCLFTCCLFVYLLFVCLLVVCLFTCCFTFKPRILSWYGDVTIDDEGPQKTSARHQRPFEVRHVLSCHACYDMDLDLSGLIPRVAGPNLIGCYDKKAVLRTFSNPDPTGWLKIA